MESKIQTSRQSEEYEKKKLLYGGKGTHFEQAGLEALWVWCKWNRCSELSVSRADSRLRLEACTRDMLPAREWKRLSILRADHCRELRTCGI